MRIGTIVLLFVFIIPIRIHVEYKKKFIVSIKFMFFKKYISNISNIKKKENSKHKKQKINREAKKNNLKIKKYYNKFKKYKKFLNKKLIRSYLKLLKLIFKIGIKIKKINLKCELFIVDAAITSIIYGLVCSSLYMACPKTKRKHVKIKIFPNFIKQQNNVEFFFLIHINLLITLTLALIITFRLLFDLLRLRRMIKKRNKIIVT